MSSITGWNKEWYKLSDDYAVTKRGAYKKRGIHKWYSITADKVPQGLKVKTPAFHERELYDSNLLELIASFIKDPWQSRARKLLSLLTHEYMALHFETDSADGIQIYTNQIINGMNHFHYEAQWIRHSDVLPEWSNIETVIIDLLKGGQTPHLMVDESRKNGKYPVKSKFKKRYRDFDDDEEYPIYTAMIDMNGLFKDKSQWWKDALPMVEDPDLSVDIQ